VKVKEISVRVTFRVKLWFYELTSFNFTVSPRTHTWTPHPHPHPHILGNSVRPESWDHVLNYHLNYWTIEASTLIVNLKYCISQFQTLFEFFDSTLTTFNYCNSPIYCFTLTLTLTLKITWYVNMKMT
jgi:hypothetical protein